MITKDYLIEQFKSPKGVNQILEIANEIISEQFPINVLYELSFDKNNQISFRASWVLEKIVWKDTLLVEPIIKNIFNDFNKITNPSCARHYGKIISYLLSLNKKNKLSNYIAECINNSNDEIIIEGCFNWLLNTKTPPAVVCWCMEILLHYKEKHPWIKEELFHIIKKIILPEKPSLMSYSKKLLKQEMTF